jgi:predicted transcriptional regulator
MEYPPGVPKRKEPAPSRPSLANAELAVMELLWDDGKVTARHVRERLYADQKNQHGTVQRLLQRLEEKGYVARDVDLPVHLFSATVSREDYATSQLELLAGRLTGGSLAPIVTRLVEQKRISRSEIDRLRAILDDEPEDPA